MQRRTEFVGFLVTSLWAGGIILQLTHTYGELDPAYERYVKIVFYDSMVWVRIAPYVIPWKDIYFLGVSESLLVICRCTCKKPKPISTNHLL